MARLMVRCSPLILPAGWELMESWPNARSYQGPGMQVLSEVELQREEGIGIAALFETLWLHVSVSRRDRIPSYEELNEVRRIFVGAGLKAIQVFPALKEVVNHHPFCLHLFASLEERDPLPDFRDAEGRI